jgi:uncharacterized protein YbcC (UPF0753/DUF2309 family)
LNHRKETPMSTIESTQSLNKTFTPPAYDEPHVWRQFEEIAAQVADAIMAVWPLRDYVAVNPYSGITDRPFLDARAFLRVFSDCETLMPLEHYRNQFQSGRITKASIQAAIEELAELGYEAGHSAEAIVSVLTDASSESSQGSPRAAKTRPVQTIAETAEQVSDTPWTSIIGDEISKFCSAHYDENQSVWKSPWKELPFFQAWRETAAIDRNPELLGIRGFRAFVAELPHTPDRAIVQMLNQLGVPEQLSTSFLLSQAFSMPGWSAWSKYIDSQHDEVDEQALLGLIAARLAYDVALSETLGVNVKWNGIDSSSASFRFGKDEDSDQVSVRFVLLRAAEIAYRNRLVAGMNLSKDTANTRKSAQLVFCIDVRSERFRRHLEAVSKDIETFGFAGFFAMPIAVTPSGQSHRSSHVPVLIKPSLAIREDRLNQPQANEDELADEVLENNLWRTTWKRLQKSALGCFPFVETLGLGFAGQLLKKTLANRSVINGSGAAAFDKHAHANSESCEHALLKDLETTGLSLGEQVDLAEGMLTNLGLTESFARLVAFCGHAAETENNPLAAALDCGACGGHSGEPNGRFAALLLNRPEVRQGLAERGIQIPDDTYFIGGRHNTTTDEITFVDANRVPESHQQELAELLTQTKAAAEQTRLERLETLPGGDAGKLLRRARDWSEVRPEWGLAGNAAFVAGPRSLTQDISLDGRVFLHTYDHESDPESKVLENVMTAPLVVAHWINMQYYASTVDNRNFGSGSKTIHNVVGGFGLLSGNSGDLMTGLPIQSLHDGNQLRHDPVRLQAFLAAPRSAIEAIIDRHEMLRDLLVNGWLHLIAVESDGCYQFSENGWKKLTIDNREAVTSANQ